MLLDQARAALEPSQTVTEVLTGGRGDTVTVGGQSRHVIGYLKDFLFAPEQARTPVSVLSGGERNRLLIARALAQPANLLVLDEPTNDLDLETLDLLQEMLGEYSGTLILVSHDRDFLDRVVGSVLVSEGDGRWVEYAGGYTDMVTQRGEGVRARMIAARAKPDVREKASTAAVDRCLERSSASRSSMSLRRFQRESRSLRQPLLSFGRSWPIRTLCTRSRPLREGIRDAGRGRDRPCCSGGSLACPGDDAGGARRVGSLPEISGESSSTLELPEKANRDCSRSISHNLAKRAGCPCCPASALELWQVARYLNVASLQQPPAKAMCDHSESRNRVAR